MTYKIIEKSILDSYKLSEDHSLDMRDLVKLIENKELIAKFIRLKAVSIQFDIWAWEWKENTLAWLEVVNQLWMIADEVTTIDKTYTDFIKKETEKEEKEEEEEEEEEDREQIEE